MFYEEELDVPLVLFNEVLDHVLRIDRIFRQPQVSGHLSSLKESNVSGVCLKSCLTRLPAGSFAVNWCEWSWQNHAVKICGMDEWTQCFSSQGLWSLFCKLIIKRCLCCPDSPLLQLLLEEKTMV